MKYDVVHFKSLAIALKELEPYIRDGEHLQTGKPFGQFDGLRSRELLANWIVCAVLNSNRGAEQLTFTSDPEGGDGVIYDTVNEKAWPTEHVLVPRDSAGEADPEALILRAIRTKQEKGGSAYASGKTLIVLLNAAVGEWFPNKVARQLPPELSFLDLWVVGLQRVENGDYIYGAARLTAFGGNAQVWIVRVAADFESWDVERKQ